MKNSFRRSWNEGCPKTWKDGFKVSEIRRLSRSCHVLGSCTRQEHSRTLLRTWLEGKPVGEQVISLSKFNFAPIFVQDPSYVFSIFRHLGFLCSHGQNLLHASQVVPSAKSGPPREFSKCLLNEQKLQKICRRYKRLNCDVLRMRKRWRGVRRERRHAFVHGYWSVQF